MQLDHSFRNIYSRVYRIMGKEKKQDTKRIEISAPFNFQHVNATLAGISPEQVSVLREQAAASRIGIADPDPTELGYAHDEGFDSDASSSYSPRYRSSSAAALARTSMLPELEDYAYYYNRRRATSVSSPRRYTRGPGSVSSTSSRRSTVSRQSVRPGSPLLPASASTSASPRRRTGVRQSVGPGPLLGMYAAASNRI